MPPRPRPARTKPRILTVANYKGGTGKSTIAVHLAASLAASGLRVVVVDASPIQTARQWCSRVSESGSPFPAEVVSTDEQSLWPVLMRQALCEDIDVVIVDCPSNQGAAGVTLSALALSDLLLVPVPPCSACIETSSRFLEDVTSMMSAGANHALQVRLVPNLVDRTLLTRTMLKRIDALPFLRTEAQLSRRTAFAAAAPLEVGGVAAGPAAGELDQLVDEVRRLLSPTTLRRRAS